VGLKFPVYRNAGNAAEKCRSPSFVNINTTTFFLSASQFIMIDRVTGNNQAFPSFLFRCKRNWETLSCQIISSKWIWTSGHCPVTCSVDLVDEIFDVEDDRGSAVAATGATGRLPVNHAECALDDVAQQNRAAAVLETNQKTTISNHSFLLFYLCFCLYIFQGFQGFQGFQRFIFVFYFKNL